MSGLLSEDNEPIRVVPDATREPWERHSTERLYALTRLDPGDYLLPSNSGRTLWRIRRYEDGRAHGLESGPWRVQVWGAWRFHRPFGPGVLLSVDDIDERDCWIGVVDGCATRAEAVAEVVRLGDPS